MAVLTPSSVLPQASRDLQADLMERVATARDRSAFAQLFGYFAPRVKSYLLRLGASDSLAEDIAQDVMVTVWRKAELFDRRQASVSTWIFRIARNRRIDAFRRDQRPPLDPEDPQLSPAPETSPDEAVEAREREGAVRDALQGLPAEQVDILDLAFFQGLSHSEIAEARGLPLGTVKSRLRLAFEKLRAKLDGVA